MAGDSDQPTDSNRQRRRRSQRQQGQGQEPVANPGADADDADDAQHAYGSRAIPMETAMAAGRDESSALNTLSVPFPASLNAGAGGRQAAGRTTRWF